MISDDVKQAIDMQNDDSVPEYIAMGSSWLTRPIKPTARSYPGCHDSTWLAPCLSGRARENAGILRRRHMFAGGAGSRHLLDYVQVRMQGGGRMEGRMEEHFEPSNRSNTVKQPRS